MSVKVVDVYLVALQLGKNPPLLTSTLVNNIVIYIYIYIFAFHFQLELFLMHCMCFQNGSCASPMISDTESTNMNAEAELYSPLVCYMILIVTLDYIHKYKKMSHY